MFVCKRRVLFKHHRRQRVLSASGVFRNSHVTVRTGNIEVKEMGSRSGSASASITTEGKILIGAVHPNVTVAYRNQKYHFLQPATNVKVLWQEDGIVVYSGKQKLT